MPLSPLAEGHVSELTVRRVFDGWYAHAEFTDNRSAFARDHLAHLAARSDLTAAIAESKTLDVPIAHSTRAACASSAVTCGRLIRSAAIS